MANAYVEEWVWRFIAVAMLFALAWLIWVLYQLAPPQLVLNSAYEAAAKARTSEVQVPQRSSGSVTAAPAAPSVEPVSTRPSTEEVVNAVEAWARAWSSKDVDRYFAAYAKDFKPPQGEPRADWEKARRQRVSAPKNVTITIDSPSVNVVADDRVYVKFNQDYRSDIIAKSVTSKVLLMVKADGRWLIQREMVGD